MSSDEKTEVFERVEASPGTRRKVMAELGVPKSTYYRWRARLNQGGLEDRSSGISVWNRLTPEEESVVLEVAMEHTELSSRQLATWITDNKGFSVSESTVYRILRREGLVKSPEMKMAAGKEFHTKTTRPHEMWATDASYFRVAGWGFYYMVTVMDDFSRLILSWKLQRDMTSDSFIEVVQDAVDLTGMTVEGKITSKKLQTVPSKASGGSSRRESRFTLDVKKVIESVGNDITPDKFIHPTFGGTTDLLDRFEIGDYVWIVTTTSTGREIKEIDHAQ